MPAARRARQIGATALQIFSDNPTAWRRRPEPPRARTGLHRLPAAPRHRPGRHPRQLPDQPGRQRRAVRHAEPRRALPTSCSAPRPTASRLVNTHIGSHRGGGRDAGLRRIVENVDAVLADSPSERDAGAGELVRRRRQPGLTPRGPGRHPGGGERRSESTGWPSAWTPPTCGARATTSRPQSGATQVLDRFDELIGLERLALVHLNDSRSELGSRNDRHEHVGAGRIGPEGLAAILRDPRLRPGPPSCWRRRALTRATTR